jgi:hypothetical protein
VLTPLVEVEGKIDNLEQMMMTQRQAALLKSDLDNLLDGEVALAGQFLLGLWTAWNAHKCAVHVGVEVLRDGLCHPLCLSFTSTTCGAKLHSRQRAHVNAW